MRGLPSQCDVVCVGETMVLFVPDPPRPPESAATFRRDVGGAESNVAIHLSRLGRTTSWHSVVGDDAFGRFLRARIAEEGVACDAVRVALRHRTGLYVKELGRHATTVAYYRDGSAASTLDPSDLAGIWALRPRIVHTTGITAVLSPSSRDMVAELLQRAPHQTLRSFDVNYRPGLHDDNSPALLRDLAQRADLVFCGLDEAHALWGVTSVHDVRDLLDRPHTLVVKQGSDGATAFHGADRWHQSAPPVDVVEPIGAGDAFAAGVLDGILDGVDLQECLARGAGLAGQVLQVDGDLPARSWAVQQT